jgi:hypothetical protein
VKAFRIELEVVDQRFHRLLHLTAFRWNDLAVFAGDRTLRHLRQTLLDDLGTLVDFLHAHHEAVIAIGVRADGDVELHTVIHIVGWPCADPKDPGSPDHGSRETPGERVGLLTYGDVHVALLEDAVVHDKAHRIAEQFRQARVDPVANVDQQLFRYVLMHAAGTEVAACMRAPLARS